MTTVLSILFAFPASMLNTANPRNVFWPIKDRIKLFINKKLLMDLSAEADVTGRVRNILKSTDKYSGDLGAPGPLASSHPSLPFTFV